MVIMTIDTTDEQLKEEIQNQRDCLLYEKNKKGYYDVNDFFVVRTTNYLDVDRIIKPLFHVPFVTKNNHLIKSVIEEIMDETEPIDFYTEMDKYTARSQRIKENYLPYSSQYRSTVHFAVNGLVSSHSKGNFENKNFIIIDPLNYHLQNNDIRAFRMEDTYMYGDVKISPEAVVMISQERYEDLMLQYPQLCSYNIVLYKGNETMAVEMYLTSIGIISEKISEHGSLEHSCTRQIFSFRKQLKEVYGIDSEPHWLSQEYRKDDENSLMIWDYYNNLFYTHLLKNLGVVDPEYSIRLSDLMDTGKEIENQEYLKQIIKKIGLEQFQQIVNEFNRNILENIANGEFKNNEEIIKNLTSISKLGNYQ